MMVRTTPTCVSERPASQRAAIEALSLAETLQEM
jgi:hypothetical protein